MFLTLSCAKLGEKGKKSGETFSDVLDVLTCFNKPKRTEACIWGWKGGGFSVRFPFNLCI